MSGFFSRLLRAAGIWALLVASAPAQVPQLIHYQGRLLSGTNLVNGTVGLSLRLFDAGTLGNLLYEDSNTVTVTDGLYSTFMGDSSTIGSLTNALISTNVFVEVAVNGSALAPRERLASVAYAMSAQTASEVSGPIPASQLPSTVPKNDRVTIDFQQPNGSGLESSANLWTRAGMFVFRGTAAGGTPTNAIALMYTVNPNTYYRVRLYDAANNQVIALGEPSNTGSISVPGIVNLGSLANLPAGQGVFEIHILATDVTGNTSVSGRQAVGIYCFQTF